MNLNSNENFPKHNIIIKLYNSTTFLNNFPPMIIYFITVQYANLIEIMAGSDD